MPEENSQENNQANRAREEYSRRLRAMQMEQQKRDLAKKYMTIEAYERLMNVRIANRELYEQLLGLVIQMVQQNRVEGKLTEDQLKQILARLTFKPESKIEFKRK